MSPGTSDSILRALTPALVITRHVERAERGQVRLTGQAFAHGVEVAPPNPRNLAVVVLDDGVRGDERAESASAPRRDLAAVARGHHGLAWRTPPLGRLDRRVSGWRVVGQCLALASRCLLQLPSELEVSLGFLKKSFLQTGSHGR